MLINKGFIHSATRLITLLTPRSHKSMTFLTCLIRYIMSTASKKDASRLKSYGESIAIQSRDQINRGSTRRGGGLFLRGRVSKRDPHTHSTLFPEFFRNFFNFLSAKEEELSHKSHTCVKNNTHVFYSTHMPVQKRTLSTTTKRSVLIYTRRRFTNPVMLTQQYMTRVHKEIENCGRVRWTYAWLGVSGALDE